MFPFCHQKFGSKIDYLLYTNVSKVCTGKIITYSRRKTAAAITVVQSPSLLPLADWAMDLVMNTWPLVLLYLFFFSSHARFGIELNTECCREHSGREVFSVFSGEVIRLSVRVDARRDNRNARSFRCAIPTAKTKACSAHSSGFSPLRQLRKLSRSQ